MQRPVALGLVAAAGRTDLDANHIKYRITEVGRAELASRFPSTPSKQATDGAS
jgi:hypothetical protein